LIGCSMGGNVAGVYAAQYPDSLNSVCLVCPHGINHEHQNKVMKEAKETGKFKSLPQTIDELRFMYRWSANKQVEVPHDLVLNGILQLRLEKNDFFRMRMF